MKKKIKNAIASLLIISAAVFFVNGTARAEVTTEGWDETRSVYYVKDDEKIVKANGIVKVDQDYLYFEKGVLQSAYTGLKKIKDDDTFELYYIENGKAAVNTWQTVEEKTGKFTYYFGAKGKAYKADSISGMRTTKVAIKKVEGVKYGFDEDGHSVKGLWSTDTKLAFFNKKTGVYDQKATKKYQKAVKRGKKSAGLDKKIKKTFGKPKKVKKNSSCNPFDIKSNQTITSSMLKNYKGYNYIYKNIVISMTKNTKTGVYYMDGAGPIDLD